MFERLKNDWERVAKEKLEIEQVDSTIYAFGSELACLRLYHHYEGNKDTKAAYSQNLKTWYFRLEM